MRISDVFENQSSEEIYRRCQEEYLYSSSHLCPPLPAYDPIFTPIFTSILGTATIGATTITYASIASAIAVTALSIGIQMLLAPKPPAPEDVKAPKSQPIPFRQYAVGRSRMGGAYMLWEAKGTRLFTVQALAGHRIKSINRYWLHDDEVSLDASGYTTNTDDEPYSNSVRILSRKGLATETSYSNVTSYLGSTIWSSQHRGDGQASVSMEAQSASAEDQQKRFPYGPPSLSVEGDWALCWDFRDSAQSPTDPTTWKWTQNCAVICCWHLCFNEFGFGLDYRKAILPVLDYWVEEANICDEDIPLAGGGTEKRYQCNGSDTTENGPKSGLNAILAACDGHLVARGDGARILTVGKFRESRCSTITDNDIIGHQIQYDVLPEDEINRLVPKFTYPATGYTSADTDFFEDTAAQLEAGRVLSEDANYQWVHQWRQARRLGKRDWLRLQEKVKGTLTLRLSGINAVYSRWVRIQSPLRLPNLNGRLVENRRSVLALTRGGFSMDFMLHPENIDAWTPSVDEGQQPPVPQSPNAEAIPVPVINLLQAKANSGAVYIRVVIIDPSDTSVTPVVRYRVADAGSGNPGAWVEQKFPKPTASGGYVELATSTVPGDVVLDLQVAFIGSDSSYGNWCATQQITSTADPTPPAVIPTASATGGVGQATFTWTAPNSANYAGARVYWNTVNNFLTATQVSPPEYGAPGAADSRVVTGLSAGTKYGWVVAINKSGVAAAEKATGAFTVT